MRGMHHVGGADFELDRREVILGGRVGLHNVTALALDVEVVNLGSSWRDADFQSTLGGADWEVRLEVILGGSCEVPTLDPEVEVALGSRADLHLEGVRAFLEGLIQGMVSVDLPDSCQDPLHLLYLLQLPLRRSRSNNNLRRRGERHRHRRLSRSNDKLPAGCQEEHRDEGHDQLH